MTTSADIRTYIDALSATDIDVCDQVVALIERGLPQAEGKVWHAHPVWFLDGNPIVSIARRKNEIRIMFFSGQSFREAGLRPEGSFQAAEIWLNTLAELDTAQFTRWLAESRDIQWNYKDIRKNRGLVKLTNF